MFELLSGNIVSVDSELLAVLKIRIGVVGERVNTFEHYCCQNEIELKTAEQFCEWSAEGLENDTVQNINREADFA